MTRSGRRITRGPIVVHLRVNGGSGERARVTDGPALAGGEPRAGFVVGRKVGNAVVRNRVRRRLREQMRTRLPRVPRGGLVIVRALPPAATASSADLGHALDSALRALTPARPASPLGAASSPGSRAAGTRATVRPERRPEPVES